MKKPRIIYFFDPLCITCYSFAPVIRKIIDNYGKSIDLDLITGGMVTGNRVGPVAQKAEYLKKKIAALENTTETRFGDDYKKLIDKGAFISDSTPPSIAWVVFRSFRPDLRFEIAHDIQEAHYRDGKDLNGLRTYFDICEKHGINKHGFMERFQDPAFKKITLDLFKYARDEKVEQFPSLRLESPEGLKPVLRGYEIYQGVASKLDGITGSKNP